MMNDYAMIVAAIACPACKGSGDPVKGSDFNAGYCLTCSGRGCADHVEITIDIGHHVTAVTFPEDVFLAVTP